LDNTAQPHRPGRCGRQSPRWRDLCQPANTLAVSQGGYGLPFSAIDIAAGW